MIYLSNHNYNTMDCRDSIVCNLLNKGSFLFQILCQSGNKTQEASQSNNAIDLSA